MFKKLLTGVLVSSISAGIIAQDFNGKKPEEINSSDIMVENPREVSANVCFDASLRAYSDWYEKYKLQDTVYGYFDEQGCVIEERVTDANRAELAKLIVSAENFGAKIIPENATEVKEEKIHMVLKHHEYSNLLKDNTTIKGTMSRQDKLELSLKSVAGVVIGGLSVGYMASKKFYVFDQERQDKYKHTIVGGAISLGSSLGSYYLLEETNWGQNLPLSKLARERIILLSGPFMACLAGGLKEKYDSYHQNTHTVDKNDFFATCLGGGALTVPLVFIKKNIL